MLVVLGVVVRLCGKVRYAGVTGNPNCWKTGICRFADLNTHFQESPYERYLYGDFTQSGVFVQHICKNGYRGIQGLLNR